MYIETSIDAAARDASDFVIGSQPPAVLPHRRQERSVWPSRLVAGRDHPMTWIQISEPFTRATAAQVASDLRSSHRRDPLKMRVAGVVATDRWEARYANHPADSDVGHFYLWFRYVGASKTEIALDEAGW